LDPVHPELPGAAAPIEGPVPLSTRRRRRWHHRSPFEVLRKRAQDFFLVVIDGMMERSHDVLFAKIRAANATLEARYAARVEGGSVLLLLACNGSGIDLIGQIRDREPPLPGRFKVHRSVVPSAGACKSTISTAARSARWAAGSWTAGAGVCADAWSATGSWSKAMAASF
jgi:hypothetical protein